MDLLKFFRNTPEPTREELREQHIAEADSAMREAGQLFDETVNQLSLAKAVVDASVEEADEMIDYHQKQITQEEKTKERLGKRSASIDKVINNVKTMFFFDVDDNEEEEAASE